MRGHGPSTRCLCPSSVRWESERTPSQFGRQPELLCVLVWFLPLVLVGLFMAASPSWTYLFMGSCKCNEGGVRSWCSFVSLRHSPRLRILSGSLHGATIPIIRAQWIFLPLLSYTNEFRRADCIASTKYGYTECFSAFQRRIFGSFVYNVDMMGDDTSCFLSSRLFLYMDE